MIPTKAQAAQWQSTHLNSGVQGWRGRVKPLQQDKGRCHPQAPTAAGGEGRNGHHEALLCSRAACSHTTALLPAPQGGSKVLCFHRLLLQQSVLIPLTPVLSPPGPGTPWGHCCAGWGHRHAPHRPSLFSALTERTNLAEANFSRDAGQEAPELLLPTLGRAGSITRT